MSTPHPRLRRSPVAVPVLAAAGVCLLAVAAGILYVSQTGAGSEPKSLVSDGQHAPLPLAPTVPSGAASDRSQKSGVDARAVADRLADQVAELAATQARLEAAGTRLENLVERMDKQLKQGGLLPLTREENQKEVRRTEAILGRERERRAAADLEVQRFGQTLGVPDAVRGLRPDAALSDPRLSPYRAYFEARQNANFAQLREAAAESAFLSAATKSY